MIFKPSIRGALFTFALSNVLAQNITLRAAQRHVDLAKKDGDIYSTNSITLTYTEDNRFENTGPSMVLTLSLQSNRPVLLLENFDHLLKDVDCSDSMMVVTFQYFEHYTTACSMSRSLLNGWIVSSHLTCSEEGAHSVFSVLGIDYNNQSLSITFYLEETLLRSAFQDITFELTNSYDPYVVHTHDRLARRQYGSTDESTSSTNLIHTPTTTRPVPTASEPPPDSTQTADLGFSALNSTFKLPGNKSMPFDLGCRNCTGTGSLALKTTKFSFNELGSDDDDIIKSGAIEIDLTGFSLSIGLRATPKDNYKKTITIFDKNLIGVQIPKVGHVGLDFELDLEFRSDINQSVALGFGFDVTVPDSRIVADIAETQNSGIFGFNPTVTAQVLHSNISDVEVIMTAVVQPKFLAGIEILGIEFGVGPFLNLPHLKLNTTQLQSSNVGADCKANSETAQKFKDSFTNLTLVEYDVGIGGGIDIDLGFFGNYPITFSSTQWPLATQCLVYKSGGPTVGLAVATSVLAEITRPPQTSTATGHTGRTKGAGSALVSPGRGLYVMVFICGVLSLST